MILDSNVVIALFQNEQQTMFEKIAGWRAKRPIHINLVIYAEVSPSFVSPHGLKLALDRLGIEISPITLDEAFRAGQAFTDYRRRGGRRATILPDFLIGAQAEVRGWPLVTRDRKGFASYFPDLNIIDPCEGDP